MTILPIDKEYFDCRPPFSLYFDLIKKYWKVGFGTVRDSPIHRVCTLARKMGAVGIIVESASYRDDIVEEINEIDAVCGGNVSFEAIAINFFSEDVNPDTISEANSDSFLGQVTVINYFNPPTATSNLDRSYIYEAIFRNPRLLKKDSSGKFLDLLNNYIHASRNFIVKISDVTFEINGFYYCQQNLITGVCAHSSLKMSLNSIEGSHKLLTDQEINQILNIQPPFSGLSPDQIEKVIESKGFKATFYDCNGIKPNKYLTVLHSYIESGFSVIFGFSTDTDNHVVSVFGHTLNSDAWHPQAIRAYAGPPNAGYLPASSWIDHFLINDDNFGPYYSLSCSSLSIDPVKALLIIGILPNEVILTPDDAQDFAIIFLKFFSVQLFNYYDNNWTNYLKTIDGPFVLRTFLINKDEYIADLKNTASHDGSVWDENDFIPLNNLPDKVWMTEFTLPNLYSGNKTKLGEVLIDPTQSSDLNNPFNILLGIRAPGVYLSCDDQNNIEFHASSLTSHSPMYSRIKINNEW